MMTPLPLEVEITPGEHKVGHIGGLAFNLDTIWSTLIALVIVLGLGLAARRALTKKTDDKAPTKLQIFWETLVSQVQAQVTDNLGRVHPFVFPLAVSLFFFILVSNWLELLPTDFGSGRLHITPAPTGDVNATYPLALLVFVSTWVYGISQRGFRGYFGGFVSDKVAENKVIDFFARGFFTSLNILEELIKPVTLALRLFGNIFAGGIMLALIAALMHWQISSIPVGGVLGFFMNIIWKLFDMFIGAIQAFIFALLTILYFSMAATGHGGGEHDEHGDLDEHDALADSKTPELAT